MTVIVMVSPTLFQSLTTVTVKLLHVSLCANSTVAGTLLNVGADVYMFTIRPPVLAASDRHSDTGSDGPPPLIASGPCEIARNFTSLLSTSTR